MTNSKIEHGNSNQFNGTSLIRAPKSGLFLLSIKRSITVDKGDVLGFIHRIDASKKAIRINASRSGVIIENNGSPLVNQGDALFHLLYNKQ